MKKIVPDPPTSPSNRPHRDALEHAHGHLNTAIAAANQLPGQPQRKRDSLMASILMHTEMARSLLCAALGKLPAHERGAPR